MANVHLHIPSFNAGELSPLLGARFAVEKVASGCRKLRNFIAHVHGPVFRRPGMEYLGPAASDGAKSSLRGFNFSTTTGFVLEFHPSGLRVWSNGQLVPLRSPVPLPYNEAQCAEIQLAQVNDVTYIAHPSHEPRKLVRYADDDWRLETIEWVWPALGDENVRTAEVATPTATLILEHPTYEWPEFEMPDDTEYQFSVTGAIDLSPALKVVKLWQWSKDPDPKKSEWVLRKTIDWRQNPPDAVTGTTNNKNNSWRITYNEPLATGGDAEVDFGAGSFTLPLDSAERETLGLANVPAGDWQMTVECGDIPPGATLDVERRAQGEWEYFRSIALEANRAVVKRGPKLDADTNYRFVWGNKYSDTKKNRRAGRAMFLSPGVYGKMRFESITFPAAAEVTIASNGVNGNDRTLTASAPLFRPGHVGSYWQIVHRRESSGAEIAIEEEEIEAQESAPVRVAEKWEVYTYGVWSATLYLERKVGGVWETVRSWTGRKDRNVIATGEEADEVEMRLRITDGVLDAGGGVARPRFVLETSDARVTGLVKITAVGSPDNEGKSMAATCNVLTALHSTDPTSLWTEGAWSDVKGFPRAVALHGQRLWFGGTDREPLRLWGSAINDYEDFRRASFDDAGVSFTPAAQQSNRLQWLTSFGESLVLGTNGDEWTLSGGTERGPITPVSVQMQRRSGYGSKFLPSILVGETIVFAQRGGRKLRSVAPRQDGLAWMAADMTVLAEHVASAGIVQMAAMNFPQTILWAVTGDGKLIGMTFEQEQNVFAWHVHETDGIIESVAVVFGNESDEVWLAVSRGGSRNIERLNVRVMSRRFDAPEKLVYLDAAVVREDVSGLLEVSGLGHLEKRTVGILADGADAGTRKVVNGAIRLDAAAATVVVGLPYLSEVQPMRLEIPLRDGSAQHRPWRTSRVGLFVHESLGGEVADAPDARFEKLQYRRVGTPMDGPPPLQSGEVETAIEARSRSNADVIVRATGPHPFNLGSITLKSDVYGE